MDDALATAEDSESGDHNVHATWTHEDLAQVKVKEIKAHTDSVNSCEYIDKDTKLLTGSSDKTVRVFNVEDGVCLRTYSTGHEGIITEARTAPDLSRFMTCSWDKSVRMFDFESGKEVWSGKHNGMVMSCKVSPDGTMVASGSDLDNCLTIRDAQSGEIIHSFPDYHKSTITSVLFAPDSDKVITTSMDRTTRFFDLRSSKSTIHIEGHFNMASCCDITRDERKFATVGWDKIVCIWDIATGNYRSKGPVKMTGIHEGSLSCCKFSPDGLMLVTGSYDQTIVVWDVENEVQKIRLQGHTDWVQDSCFTQDQAWVMSCSKDHTVRLWNIEDSDKIPVVMENKRAIGVKIVKCEECGKPFSMAQMEQFQDLTRCVFCRVHTSESYFEQSQSELEDPET